MQGLLKIVVLWVFGMLSSFVGNAQSLSVSLNPSKDNSIFSENPNNSSGASSNLYIGLTGALNNNGRQRGLLQFNLSSIPNNAQIDSAVLRIPVIASANSNNLTHTFTIHRLLKDWGEGVANDGLGRGEAALSNEATWLSNYHSSSLWTNPGGDYVAIASASAGAKYDFPLQYGTWRGAGVKADIETWLASPATNYGWVVIGQENVIKSAKRFTSREETFFPKPALLIYYKVPATDNVLINEVNPQKKWVELYNPSKPVVNLANYWICNGLNCEPVSGGNVVLLNGSLSLDSAKYTVVRWSGLSQTNGEIALYNGNPSNMTTQMKDYIQYGSGNQSRAANAVTAMVWNNASTFLTNISADTLSYSTNGNNVYASGQATNASDYVTQRQTPTYKNLICPPTLNLSGAIIEAKYSSIGQLKLTGSLASPNSVKLTSQQSILLEATVHVPNGTIFEAKIEGCNP